MRLVLVLLMALGLSACYEVRGPTVTEGVRVNSIRDGVWQRSDGSEVALNWDAASASYGVSLGGKVRLAPLGQLWLADYQAERNIVMVAALRDDAVVFLAPSPEAEKRLATGHGLALKAGPIKLLVAGTAERKRYLTDIAALAGTPDLVEVERLTWMRP